MTEFDNTQFLPTNFRNLVGHKNRIQCADIQRYLDLYNPIERLAISNNFKAYKWGLGFVPEIHSSFLSSGIGTVCIDTICETAVNGKISVGGTDEAANQINNALKTTLTSSIEDLFRLTALTGSALNRICFSNNKAFIKSTPLGQFKATVNEFGEVIDCETFLDVQDRQNGVIKYILCEHRYFKEGKPYSIFQISMLNYSVIYNIENKTYGLEEIKKNKALMQYLQEVYPNVELYKETELPFTNSLGASITNWTKHNSYYHSMWFGDAMLVGVMDLLYSYDHAFTAKENDKYLGRGHALVPKQMTSSNITMNKKISQAVAGKTSMANVPTDNEVVRSVPLDKTFYQELTTQDGVAIKPTSIQFNLRTAEWRMELEGTAGDIASKLHISGCDLDSRLNGGSQRTATEINKESDMTIKLVNSKRLQFEDAILELIYDIAEYLGYKKDSIELTIKYPSAGLSNPQVATAVITQQVTARLLSKETAIKELHPEWTDKDIEEEIGKLNEESMIQPEVVDDEDYTE